ncbi:MAG: DUF4037 domain-containing protein [Armatimonadota bacterium]
MKHNPVLSEQTTAMVQELIPLFRQFATSEYGIAIGGAHAKGVADDESDLDIYLFSSSILSNDDRTRLTGGFSPDITEIVTWGVEQPFEQGGSDFYYKGTKVECWLRSSELIDGTISECREGIIKQELVRWTTTGFYNHCCLSDLQNMIPVDDRCGLLARWQHGIAEYPPDMQKAIIEKHLSGARFWPHNFHYSSAVERQDIIYTTGIVQQVVHNLIQVLFAVNKSYFPGDKKLAKALGRLDRLPYRFVDRIHELLFPGTPATVELLRQQQLTLQQLLKDVEELVMNSR